MGCCPWPVAGGLKLGAATLSCFVLKTLCPFPRFNWRFHAISQVPSSSENSVVMWLCEFFLMT